MEVHGGGGQDSGVETEGDQESNDSSLSSVSIGAPLPPPQPQFVTANSSGSNSANEAFQVPLSSVASTSAARSTPEPNLGTFLHPNNVQPPPSVTEDGYLGDCSSDGGNEKNFPMPSHSLKRLVNGKSCACHPNENSGHLSDPEGSSDPPAGLSFQNLAVSGSFGYQVLPQNLMYNSKSNLPAASRKMKSSLKSRLVVKADTWCHMTAALTERKLRTASSTNNTDTVRRLLANGVNVNCSDQQQRAALHFAASKGYSEVVNLLLQYGADPNAKDILGNTALHLAACTNHIEVVTLLLRAGTDVTTLDNSGRTPIQLAQSKLKLLQRNSSKSAEEMTQVRLLKIPYDAIKYDASDFRSKLKCHRSWT